MPSKITMKAAVVEKFGEPLVLREVPIPTPGQARVEVFATGVCHTDLRCGRRLANQAKAAVYPGSNRDSPNCAKPNRHRKSLAL